LKSVREIVLPWRSLREKLGAGAFVSSAFAHVAPVRREKTRRPVRAVFVIGVSLLYSINTIKIIG
jgi:hypothetical protein